MELLLQLDATTVAEQMILCCFVVHVILVTFYADHAIQQRAIGKAYTCMIHVPARTTSHPSESHGKACKMRKTRGTWKLTGLTCTIAETPTKFSSFLVCVQCRRDYCSSNNFYMDDLISFSPLASLPRFPQPDRPTSR